MSFVSYELGNQIAGSYDHYFKIIDTDFVETGIIETLGIAPFIGIEKAIIITYENRNLNVAANLALGIKWKIFNSGYPETVEQILKFYSDNLYFKRYRKELEKYLVLL